MCFFQFNLFSHHKHAGPEPQSQCLSSITFKIVTLLDLILKPTCMSTVRDISRYWLPRISSTDT